MSEDNGVLPSKHKKKNLYSGIPLPNPGPTLTPRLSLLTTHRRFEREIKETMFLLCNSTPLVFSVVKHSSRQQLHCIFARAAAWEMREKRGVRGSSEWSLPPPGWGMQSWWGSQQAWIPRGRVWGWSSHRAIFPWYQGNFSFLSAIQEQTW